jgi:hypothetical protein
MVDRLSPRQWQHRERRGKCRHQAEKPERRADAIRRLGLLALLCLLTATPANQLDFALISPHCPDKAAILSALATIPGISWSAYYGSQCLDGWRATKT